MHAFLVRAGAALFLAAVLSGLTLAATPSAGNQATEPSTAELVAQALNAEVAGNNAERDALIDEAVRRAPNDQAARWHGGQVRFNGAWCSPAEVAELAKKDARLAEYRQRRQSAGATVEEQAELARWCQRNKLDEEQRVHWLNVLSLRPNHPEAIKALRLQAFQGTLLPKEQVERLIAQQQQVRKSAERWKTLVALWRRAKSDPEKLDRAALADKLRKIDEPTEMMGLEQALWQQVALKPDRDAYHAMLAELTEALDGNPSPVATQFLTRCAVVGPTAEARTAAIAALKKRPLDDYVPVLLAGLRSPVDVNMNFDIDGSGHLITRCSFWEEGPMADVTVAWSSAFMLSAGEPLLVGANGQPLRTPTVDAHLTRNLASSLGQAGPLYAKMADHVALLNETIQAINARICEVLRQATGMSLGDLPTAWWDWWLRKHNEYVGNPDDEKASESYTKPEYSYDYHRKAPVSPGSVPSSPGHGTPGSGRPSTPSARAQSCFARGTPVWTLDGLRPIEEIVIGDRVLAQDVESGELGYKAVLAVTYRPPGPRLKLVAGDDTIVATPAHPFWVCGQSWRFTKQLAAGEPLHTLEGAVKINAIEKLAAPVVWHDGAYNLIVADFNTYFVGKRAILVHDNTPRQPTACLVPGLKRK